MVTAVIDRPPLIRRLWTGALLVNAFLAGVVVFMLVQSRLQYEQTAAVRVDNLSLVLAQGLSSSLSRIDQTLIVSAEEVSEQLAQGGLDGTHLNAYLARRLAFQPELSILGYANANGDVDFGAGVLPMARINVADRSYFIQLRDDPRSGLAISKPVMGRIQQIWVIVFARRVNYPDGAFAGVLYASLSLESITRDFFSTISIGQKGLVTLWDEHLTIIARHPEHTDRGSVIGQQARMPEFLELVRSGKTSGMFEGLNARDGIERIYSYRRLPGYPFSITLGIAPSEYLEVWRKEAAFLSGLALLFMLVTTLSARTIHRGWKRQEAAVSALEVQEEKFRALVETTDDWIWETDAEGRYTYASPKAAELLGYSPGELIGKNPADFMAPDEAGRFQAAIESALKNGSGFQGVERNTLRKDGGRVVLESSGTPFFDRNGRLAGYRGIDRDVTERARMLEALVQSEKMVSVGGLASGMAHEINNPLGGILQSVQVLDRRLGQDGPSNERAASEAGCGLACIRDFLRIREVPVLLGGIKDAATRAARIVANMLELSRRGGSAQEPASLAAVLDRAVELCLGDNELDRKFGFRAIRIERDYDPEAPEVVCSSTQMEQVFMNLLINSAQSMAEFPLPGREPVIALRTRPEGEGAKVEVEDNGPGMDEATKGRVFEPFFTTRATGKGTGLGLSVSYFIVTRMHGGSIEVESEPGRGTRFVITLPGPRQRKSTENGEVGEA